MGKDRLVTITEVEAPQFDIPVSWTTGEESSIRGDVQRQHGQFVTIERQEELSTNTPVKCQQTHMLTVNKHTLTVNKHTLTVNKHMPTVNKYKC